MRLLKISAEGLMMFQGKMELDFFAEQRVISGNTEMLYKAFGNIYTNNVISIVGINASGKTSLLKVIAFTLKMLNGEPINNISSNDILGENSPVIIDTIFDDENGNIYKLHTEICHEITGDLESRYFIKNEVLYKKSAAQVRAKKDIALFDESNHRLTRDEKAEFLKDDISIVISINRNNGFKNKDLIELTNMNYLGLIGDFPRELIEFLDPSIEKIAFHKQTKSFLLKFYDRNPIEINSPLQFEKYLSSGTIKGLNIFINAMITFQEGGYLLIDELENHFNREIVATLIRFFMNEKVNGRGATLIFSTHYAELLDEFERNDSIYIVRNRGGITVQKLYEILKRNDVKKSEAFKSDYLEGTVPSYDAYIHLKNAILQSKIKEG